MSLHTMKLCLYVLLLVTFLVDRPAAFEPLSSREIREEIESLQVFGSVLYIAAHPDDENTQLITYLANSRHYETTYLSLTRGDGGQNLIGSDLRERLGLIRTHELLAARAIDGGQQRFTRAVDFGYSKSAEESFRLWGKESVLEDVVRVIRETKPDVIITRFSTEPGYTHGHHTAATWLAQEAFKAAADPDAFKDTLGDLEPWQATRLIWNVSWWSFRSRGEEFVTDSYLGLDVGSFDFPRGQSYPQIAALSRSQHQSQGFGTIASLAQESEYFELLDGEPMEGDIFSAIDTSSARLIDDPEYGKLIDRLLEEFDDERPYESFNTLSEIRDLLLEMEPSYWRDHKLQDINRVLLSSAGLEAQLNTSTARLPQGSSHTLDFKIVHRSPLKVTLKNIQLFDKLEEQEQALDAYTVFESEIPLKIPSTMPISQPYWLIEDPTLGQFQVSDREMIGRPLNPAPVEGTIDVEIEGVTIRFAEAAVHRFRDPVRGEVVEPVSITPPLTVALNQSLIMAADQNEKIINVTLEAGVDDISGKLIVDIEGDWTTTFKAQSLSFNNAGDQETLSIDLTPSETSGEATLHVSFELDGGERLDRGLEVLSYDHIPPITFFPKAEARLVRVDAQIAGDRIGYLPGAGDVIPESLRLLGYEVIEFEPDSPNSVALDNFDAIVLGIRALNVHANIDQWLERLFQYTEDGGTLIIQYNTNRNLKTTMLGDDLFQISRDRVTDEFAAMRLLAPEHPVLNAPNKISARDFDGWVQERGLYFADTWGPNWTPILSSNDSDEPPRDGGLLVKRSGDGWVVYTGISFFRQLPAGVPGAYRLFANLVSLSSSNGEEN